MSEVIIHKTGYFFFFAGGDRKRIRGLHCSLCNAMVDPEYAFIINELKRKNLLEKGYPFLCCNCKIVCDVVGNVRCDLCMSEMEIKPQIERVGLVYSVYCQSCHVVHGRYLLCPSGVARLT